MGLPFGANFAKTMAGITTGQQSRSPVEIEDERVFLDMSVLDMMSWQETREETAIAFPISVGAAGFEVANQGDWDGFGLFNVNNMYIMGVEAVATVGSPEGLTLGFGNSSTGLTGWWAYFNIRVFGSMMADNRSPFFYEPPFKLPLTSRVQSGPLIESALRFYTGIDPTAIGDQLRVAVRVRSAPDGVPVWGVHR